MSLMRFSALEGMFIKTYEVLRYYKISFLKRKEDSEQVSQNLTQNPLKKNRDGVFCLVKFQAEKGRFKKVFRKMLVKCS